MNQFTSKISKWLEQNVELRTYKEGMQEKLNAWTHLLGSIASLVAIVAILIKGIQNQSQIMIPAIIFSLSMFVLYLSSGLYHLAKPGNLKRFGRVMDHVNIYLLIAGTYTPIIASIADPKIRNFIWIVWGLAICGILFTLKFWDRYKPFHVVGYLLVGWSILLVIKPVASAIPEGLLSYVVAGGAFYTVGVLFYAIKKIPYNHVIWHIFVILGSASFFAGVYKFLL